MPTPPLAAYAWVVVATILMVAGTAALHYEGMVCLAGRFTRRRPLGRVHVLVVMGGLMLLHIAEIWLFGFGYWGLFHLPGTGSVAGAHPLGLLDAVYLSAVTYSTVGFGDVSPVGPIRFLAGTEALIGLMMIAWSASFTYIEMSRHWRAR